MPAANIIAGDGTPAEATNYIQIPNYSKIACKDSIIICITSFVIRKRKMEYEIFKKLQKIILPTAFSISM